jgi:hypothetical protein
MYFLGKAHSLLRGNEKASENSGSYSTESEPSALSFTSRNLPCEHCKVFTADYTEIIKDLLAQGKVFLDIPYNRDDDWPKLPAPHASYQAGCHLCGLLRSSFQTTFASNKSLRINSCNKSNDERRVKIFFAQVYLETQKLFVSVITLADFEGFPGQRLTVSFSQYAPNTGSS